MRVHRPKNPTLTAIWRPACTSTAHYSGLAPNGFPCSRKPVPCWHFIVFALHTSAKHRALLLRLISKDRCCRAHREAVIGTANSEFRLSHARDGRGIAGTRSNQSCGSTYSAPSYFLNKNKNPGIGAANSEFRLSHARDGRGIAGTRKKLFAAWHSQSHCFGLGGRERADTVACDLRHVNPNSSPMQPRTINVPKLPLGRGVKVDDPYSTFVRIHRASTHGFCKWSHQTCTDS